MVRRRSSHRFTAAHRARSALSAGGRWLMRTAGMLTGRLILAGRCAARSGWPSRGAVLAGNGHLQSVAQTISAIDDDALACRQSGIDRGDIAIDWSGADLPHRNRIVGIDDVNVGAGRAALYRRGR